MICLFPLSESFAEELLLLMCSLVVKSTDKNTCTRALWVISKQNLPRAVVANKVCFRIETSCTLVVI